MELARGGSLAARCGRMPWSDARIVTRSLLSALAHAHARGVVHGDLKPANVLLTWDDGPPDIRLVDVGLIQALGLGPLTHRVMGTPAYMAPEQLRGAWRDCGPWTDLYALGCLVWTLVCGRPPFHDADVQAIREAHLASPPPPLTPRVAVPEGLEAWLGRLLAKHPLERFRHAADAAWAFEHLDDRERPPEATPGFADGAAPTTFILDVGEARAAPVLARRLPTTDAPPTLPDWRGHAASPRPLPPSLDPALQDRVTRVLPMVGRESERDHLWSTLRAVHEAAPRASCWSPAWRAPAAPASSAGSPRRPPPPAPPPPSASTACRTPPR
ncbi:MAG: serine/threonine protein kinase [Alphaproteobacteria bacterium]|nr:serine/threonine protein kinase [Alphaproteobacteria bacterium]